MQAFLKDAEANKPKTEGEQLWVGRIRDLAHDVEDIIDEFLYHMYGQKQSGGRLSRGLHKTIRYPSNLWFRHKIAKKLQKITQMIKDIPGRNQRYGVGLTGGATTFEDSQKPGQNQASSFLEGGDQRSGFTWKRGTCRALVGSGLMMTAAWSRVLMAEPSWLPPVLVEIGDKRRCKSARV
ncbi:hypothetical protein ACLB2K_025299 [Fragaria x ananassa]